MQRRLLRRSAAPSATLVSRLAPAPVRFYRCDVRDVAALRAALIVAIVPISLLIAVFQERVVGGLTAGGVKG